MVLRGSCHHQFHVVLGYLFISDGLLLVSWKYLVVYTCFHMRTNHHSAQNHPLVKVSGKLVILFYLYFTFYSSWYITLYKHEKLRQILLLCKWLHCVCFFRLSYSRDTLQWYMPIYWSETMLLRFGYGCLIRIRVQSSDLAIFKKICIFSRKSADFRCNLKCQVSYPSVCRGSDTGTVG